MTLKTVDVEEQQLGVTWDYETNGKRATRLTVTVQVLYRISGEPDYNEDPNKVPAAQKQHNVKGQFSAEDKYDVKLRVYEGDIQLPSLDTNEVQSTPIKKAGNGISIIQ